MADPINAVRAFLHVGMIIANPPIVAGKMLVPTPDRHGEIVHTFIQPERPCATSTCEQQIFLIEKNSKSCWIYEDAGIENVELARGFVFRPILDVDRLELLSIGDVSGRKFTFRAHLTSRCVRTSALDGHTRGAPSNRSGISSNRVSNQYARISAFPE